MKKYPTTPPKHILNPLSNIAFILPPHNKKICIEQLYQIAGEVKRYYKNFCFKNYSLPFNLCFSIIDIISFLFLRNFISLFAACAFTVLTIGSINPATIPAAKPLL